jgi:hypothetical protein
VWSQDNVKLCKMSIVFSSFKAIKDTSPTYQKNIIHAWQIWIKYNCLARDIDERQRKRGKYKVNSPNF